VDLQEQVAALRKRIARIDRKYASPARSVPKPPAPGRFIEDLLTGEVVHTTRGEHFETEKIWEPHRLHGSFEVSDFADLPEDLLDALSEGEIAGFAPARWAFLDTETTGLAGGAGTYPFLIGVGSIDGSGFRLRQFFMRDFAEEASLLSRLAEHLARFDVLITYNGKAYDQPLLETRFRMVRARNPFRRLRHLDLLFGARRLWKLRLASCRLVELESQILGVEREGDLPGALIPYYYLDYLRTRQAMRLVPIFHHNAIDILSLACLTAVVSLAFRSPDKAAFRHGADLLGLARWQRRSAQPEEALRLLRRAIGMGLPDSLLFPALWETAMIEKRLGHKDAAREAFAELTESRNPYRARAFEELARYFERTERDFGAALEMTRRALALEESEPLRRREQRLTARCAKTMRP
jgi:uncharacterized protein YprB with RNaseH-like and TPR domain